jgi:hypothetical protein
MKTFLKTTLAVAIVACSLGINLSQNKSKTMEVQLGLEFFSNEAMALTEKWGVALPPYYCGCPSGIAAGCYCVW